MHLQKLGIRSDVYRTEFEQKSNRDADENTRTPDILFNVPVKLFDENIYWIECKSGLSIPELSPEKHLNQLKVQIDSYTTEYGKGIIFWDHKLGFCERIRTFLPQSLHVTARSASPGDDIIKAKTAKKLNKRPNNFYWRGHGEDQRRFPGAIAAIPSFERSPRYPQHALPSRIGEDQQQGLQFPGGIAPRAGHWSPHVLPSKKGVHTLADANAREFDSKSNGRNDFMVGPFLSQLQQVWGHERAYSKGYTVGTMRADTHDTHDDDDVRAASCPTGFSLDDIRASLELDEVESKGCGKSEAENLRCGKVKCNGKTFEMSSHQKIVHLYENVFRECSAELQGKSILLFFQRGGKEFNDLAMSMYC